MTGQVHACQAHHYEAGQRCRFQEATARPRENTPAVAAREPTVKSKRIAPKDDKVAKVSWPSLCQSGDYEEAFRLIESGTPVEDEPAALTGASATRP